MVLCQLTSWTAPANGMPRSWCLLRIVFLFYWAVLSKTPLKMHKCSCWGNLSLGIYFLMLMRIWQQDINIFPGTTDPGKTIILPGTEYVFNMWITSCNELSSFLCSVTGDMDPPEPVWGVELVTLLNFTNIHLVPVKRHKSGFALSSCSRDHPYPSITYLTRWSFLK